jgi:protein gp37
MAQTTRIEWTEATWNPVTGCHQISPGCAHCYTKTFAERWRGIPGHHYEQGFDLRLWPARLEQPLRWRRPRVIFVNSMSDLFHEGIPEEYIAEVFDVMARASQHTFQVLTKREERLATLAPRLPWPENVWMGVTIENRRFVARADRLREVPACSADEHRPDSLHEAIAPVDLAQSETPTELCLRRDGVQQGAGCNVSRRPGEL